jgi:transketolase
MQYDSLQKIANDIRKTILVTANRAGAGHVGGSLSEAEILTALYFTGLMRIDPQNPGREDRDRFLLSKGHCTPGYYTALAHRGYFPVDDLVRTFDQVDSIFQAHPDMHKCPGVDYSTGSLGQGLSIGIGMAEGARLNGLDFNTWVLIGDGESQEGQLWEAFMYAGAKKVPRIVAVIDYNQVQLSSKVEDSVNPAPYADKLAAFDWQVIETDGHDFKWLMPNLRQAAELAAKGPVAVIAHTVKGKGVSFMEGDFRWHGQVPNDEQLKLALAEVKGCE